MISIVITTKNEARHLPKLLSSLRSQIYKNFEVVVVDNGSTDKTVEIAKKWGARVFNKGPERSAQRNFGVWKARGKYVLILDADMILDKNILKECADEMKKSVVALVIPEKSIGVGFWAKCKAFEREFYEGEEDIEAARFFKKSVFERFGGYDTKITGPEDYDLPLRIRKAGGEIGRIKSYIKHNEGNFSPIKSAKKKFYYASHAGHYIKKHPEMVLKQGNLFFRPIFFRKWKKLVFHPILALGMFAMRFVEALGALSGAFVSVIIRRD